MLFRYTLTHTHTHSDNLTHVHTHTGGGIKTTHSPARRHHSSRSSQHQAYSIHTARPCVRSEKLRVRRLSASVSRSSNPSESPLRPPSATQQISSCCMSVRVGNGGSLKEKASRPVFSPPWPGHTRYEPIRSRSREGAGLSGSDSDRLVSGSSEEETDLAWRCGWEAGRGSGFSQGWLRHSSAVALFLCTQTQ